MEIIYERPPRDIRRYRQELLLDGEELKATLLIRPEGAAPMEVGEEARLPGGSALLWFTFPGRWYEVGAFHGPSGELAGYYTNLVRPPDFQDSTWRVRDLFLDIWLPRGGPPLVLDREEFERARREGWLEVEEAERARAECERIRERAARGDWPPRAVRRWPLEAVPALRLRRDAPGTYWASLVSGRIIAWGLYLLGTVPVTTLAFAVLTDAFEGSGRDQMAWLLTLAGEALVLLPLTLAGRLPATRFPRPGESLTDERTLFIAALAVGLAVLILHDSEDWRPLLAGLYSTLSLFLAIFALCRGWFDRRFPAVAVAGLLVCGLALVVLL